MTDPGGAAHEFTHSVIIIEYILLLWYHEMPKPCFLSLSRLYLGAIQSDQRYCAVCEAGELKWEHQGP